MFKNGRKTIGVFVTQIHQEYQETISRGIGMRAWELGYNVAFFTNYIGYGEFQYEIGEREMANLPRYEELDGIILLPDTMSVQGFEEKLHENIRKYATCPVVSVRQKREEYYNVLIKDDTVLDEILRHFVMDHYYRKINFLTGPKDNPVSIQRLNTYRRILAEYGIPYEEDRVFYGDFWKTLPVKAVNQWLSDDDKIPEAIICANDYMAIAVCNALAERGYSVPEDIAVSGCDNINITEDFYPSITTAGIPIYEMGIEAVNKLHQHNLGIPQQKITYMDTVTRIRESCGCNGNSLNRQTMTSRRNRFINEAEEREKANSNNAFMSVDLTNAKTIDVLDRKLASYTYMNTGFTSFYLCLHKNWDFINIDNQADNTNDNEMMMEVGIKDGEWLQKEEFTRPALLPEGFLDTSPQIVYFNMLHYLENVFGYAAISFKGCEPYKPSYQGWLINICNALENIRINKKMNQLLFKLEDMYIKDELTGLYNRRALETLGQKYLKQCIETGGKLMVFTADMDKLKYINDNFGHACGDVAICEVANALKIAATDDEICMRIGGDEFVVVGLDYDQKKLKNFVERFESEIGRFNQEEDRGYLVFVSYGWNIVKPNESTTMEDCLILADSKMYQQKYEKETLYLKHMGEFREHEQDARGKE